MSSTVSNPLSLISSKPIFKPKKMDETRRLVRTSSLEKIRRFNSFICSHQYYILPALIAWLRSSQSVLHASTEKTIFFFRSLIFSHFLYKVYQVDFKILISNVLILLQKQFDSTNFLRIGMILTVVVLLFELGLCFYVLFETYVPSGLVFLIVCWFYIIYLNVRSVYFVPDEKKLSVIKKRN